MRRSWLAATAAAVVAGLALAQSGGEASAAKAGCAGYSSQAAAQVAFLDSLAREDKQGPAPGLDPDRDRIACEGLDGPFAGYAMLGYNRRESFLYGFVRLPLNPTEEGRYPCLLGNRHFPDGPRLVHLFRVRDGEDLRISADHGWGAQAEPEQGRLAWKAEKPPLPAGSYYLEVEERIRLAPFGANLCPAFRSPTFQLP
ncbi:MAG TPA: hypothetical protein VD761_10820 [Solirubrobacterales bacterium]|nr:hypothetical protein [Solirubrobacterales bacterium]